MPVHCPIPSLYTIVPCSPAEVEPLVDHLQANTVATETVTFPRGTVLTDGRLDLCKQSLGAAGCRLVTAALAGNTQIKSLLLGTDGIGDEGAEDVAKLVTGNPHLEIVYLGCNQITSAGVEKLCQALATNTTVTGLWLKRNPIGPEGASSIAAMLRTNRAIRTLDLVDTAIGPKGLASILQVLRDENSTVERLYLGGNGIETEGAAQIAQMLEANTSLKALLLNVNRIGDAGMALLADALRRNTSLEELGAASNSLSATGVSALFAAIRDPASLTHLDLGWSPSTRVLGALPNTLGSQGAVVVAEFLTQNPPLRRLDLRRTGMGENAAPLLGEALRNNTNLLDLLLDENNNSAVGGALLRNRENSEAGSAKLSGLAALDVALIRSVYRTLPKAPA